MINEVKELLQENMRDFSENTLADLLGDCMPLSTFSPPLVVSGAWLTTKRAEDSKWGRTLDITIKDRAGQFINITADNEALYVAGFKGTCWDDDLQLLVEHFICLKISDMMEQLPESKYEKWGLPVNKLPPFVGEVLGCEELTSLMIDDKNVILRLSTSAFSWRDISKQKAIFLKYFNVFHTSEGVVVELRRKYMDTFKSYFSTPKSFRRVIGK